MLFSPILLFHICGGILGLLSGAAAMSFRKGAHRHRVAGNVFVISMLSMSASGAYMGFTKHQPANCLVGVLTFYLVATAWMTARRRDGETCIFDLGAFIVPLGAGAGFAIYGLEAAKSQTGLKDGYPALLYFIFGFVALLSAAGDVRMLVRGGVFGAHRIARHLWRMCLPLLIAANSLFLGQAKLFPESFRKTNLLFTPGIVTLGFMVFWLFRVLCTNAYEKKSAPRRSDVYSPGTPPSTSPSRKRRAGTAADAGIAT
jgi:Predicted membrane protein (DUF2306)